MAFNIGRTGKEDDALMRWPPRSPDLTPCDFFLWGFVKDTVFVPPIPANLQDLRNRITAAVALVDRDRLTRVWNEMGYRIDVCLITKGGHIEHLWNIYIKKTWRVSVSIGVRNTMMRWVVYLLRIFKMFHGLMNNPVLSYVINIKSEIFRLLIYVCTVGSSVSRVAYFPFPFLFYNSWTRIHTSGPRSLNSLFSPLHIRIGSIYYWQIYFFPTHDARYQINVRNEHFDVQARFYFNCFF